MSTTDRMLSTYPGTITLEATPLRDCIDACLECAEACTSCADACLAEDAVAELTRCIRLNLDCADICEATGRVVARQTHREAALLRAQLQACVQACRVCGDECAQHGQHMEHCRVCAEACRRCEQACERLLDTIGV